MEIVGYGSIRLEQFVEGKTKIIKQRDVACMHNIRASLVSLPKGQAAGITFEFPGGSYAMQAVVGSEMLMVRYRKTHRITELVGMKATTTEYFTY